MDKETADILEEVQNYFIENNCECGEWGGDLYNRITELLKKNGIDVDDDE